MRDLQRVVSISLMAVGYATLAMVPFQGRTGLLNSPLLLTALLALGVATLLRVPRSVTLPPMPPPLRHV